MGLQLLQIEMVQLQPLTKPVNPKPFLPNRVVGATQELLYTSIPHRIP